MLEDIRKMSRDDFPNMLHIEMKNLVDRIEDMLNDYNIDIEEFVFVKFFIMKMTPDLAMKHTIERILPWKPYIDSRDDNFFYKNKKIFGELPEKHVNYVSDLWMSKTLNHDDKDEIWDFFDTFVAFAEEYKKNE